MIATPGRPRLMHAVSAWPPVTRFGAALALVLLTSGLIGLVNSDWGPLTYVTIENPGTVYIVTVTLAAVLLGYGPALAATAASMLAIFLLYSRYETMERAIVLVATMVIIVALAEWQRRAQESAERVQAKFEAILESMSDAVMVVDAAGRATDVNRAAAAVLGARDPTEALAIVTRQRADGTPATDEYGLLLRALSEGEAPQADVFIPEEYGGPRTVSAVASPVRDARGRIVGAVSVSRDITERERLREQVEQERQFTRRILDSMPVGMGVYRPDDFAVLAANPVFTALIRDLTGQEPRVGTPITDYLPNFDRTNFARLMRQALEEDRAISVERYPGTMRGEAFYDYTVQPLTMSDGTRTALMSFSDVTARVRAERERERLLQQVEQERQYHRHVLANLPVGIAVVRADDFTVLSFNEEYDASIRRAPGARPLTVGDSLLDAMSAASHDAATRLLSRVRDERAPIHSHAYISDVVPDQYYDGTIQPLDLADGTPALLITAVNVTERVRAEQEHERLRTAIDEEQRTTQLILDTAPVAIGVIRPDDLTAISVNATFASYVREMAKRPFSAGMSLRDVLPGFEASEFVHQLRRAAAEDRELSVTGYAARFPEEHSFDWTMKPLQLRDETRATLVTFADVTARMRGEQERLALLRQVERQAAQLAATFAAMVDGIAVYDAEGAVLHRNEAFYRILHLEPETAAPVWDDYVRQVDQRRADGTPMAREESHAFRALHGETIRGEIVLVRDGRGRDRFVSQNASPMRAADGAIIGAVVVFNDVTEQLRREREREQLLTLVEERRRFAQAIFDTVPASLAVVNSDALTFSAANPAFLDSVPEPYHHQGVNGRAVTAVLPHARDNGFADQLRAVGGTGEPLAVSATRYTHPTRGTTYWNETMVPLGTSDPDAHHVLYIAADVTEQIEAQQRATALAQAAAERAGQLEAVFGALTEGVILTDAAGKIVRSNAAVARILGLDDESLPPLDTFGQRFMMRDEHGVAIPQARRIALAALDGATVTNQLRRFRNARGEERWLQASVSPVRDDAGAVVGIVMTLRDVTEESEQTREREELLRLVEERRQFAQAIFDSVPVGLMVVGVRDGEIRSANNAYAHFIDETFAGGDLTGRKAALLQPTGATTPLPADAEEQYRRGLQDVAAGRVPVTVREFAYPDYPRRGETFWDITGVPLVDATGAVNDVLIVAVDTTEQTLNRRRVEELARTAQQRAGQLETVIASIADGVMFADTEGRVVLENAASQTLTGRLDAQGEARLAPEGFTHPDGAPMRREELPLARALRGELVGEQVLALWRPDLSEQRFLMCSSAPVIAPDGTITGAVAVFRDVTEMKQVEQLKDEFVSIAAHELRTPLTAIKGYADLLDRRLTVQGNREADRRSLTVIRKQTDRLAGLVNEMLDVSRIEAGRLHLNREPFDLPALVGEVMNNMRVASDAHTFSLIAAPGIVVDGDSARIEQVLMNLISNAVTYSPEGGEIALRVWAEDGTAFVSVRDRGVGIAQEELPHLFDRFYRAPRAGVMRSGGMGLGLYICQEIIARHGGAIRAESREGAGSTFTFSLPLHQ